MMSLIKQPHAGVVQASSTILCVRCGSVVCSAVTNEMYYTPSLHVRHQHGPSNPEKGTHLRFNDSYTT
jgi:hypothetical protein